MTKQLYTTSQKIKPYRKIHAFFFRSQVLVVLSASSLEAHESLFAVLEGNEISWDPSLNYTEDIARLKNSNFQFRP